MLTFSVVILTDQRPALLKRSLDSVFADPAAVSFECFVIVNGPSDSETSRILAANSHRVRTLRVERQYPGSARNAALPVAQGQWILFLDDDAYLPPEWWLSLLRVLAQNPDADIIGGPNLTPPTAPRFQQILGRTLQSRFAAYVSSRRYQDRPWRGICGDESIMLCNLLVRRAAIEHSRVHFNPELPCNEENLFVQQLLAAGRRAHYDSDFWVFHERRADLIKLAKQVFKYGRGRAANTWLRPSSIRWPHLVPSLCLVGAAMGGAWVALPGLLTYLALLLACSARAGDPLALLIFPTIHLSYAAGFLIEAARFKSRSRFQNPAGERESIAPARL